jgi:UV DNA damage repair endonuclease
MIPFRLIFRTLTTFSPCFFLLSCLCSPDDELVLKAEERVRTLRYHAPMLDTLHITESSIVNKLIMKHINENDDDDGM